MGKVTVTGRLVSNIFKPKAQEQSGIEKYWVQVVLDEGQLDKLRQQKQILLKEVFGDKIPQGSALSDYVERKGDDPEYENTFNQYFVRSSHKNPIKCYIKPSPSELKILDAEEAPRYLYAGARVAVSLDLYGKTKADAAAAKLGGKAFISSSVRALMFLRHDNPLGEGAVSANEFEGVTSEITEEDFGV